MRRTSASGRRPRRALSLAATALVAAGATTLATAATASAGAHPRATTATAGTAVAGTTAKTSGPHGVIVVLKDQLTKTPADRKHLKARATAATRAQNAVLAKVPGKVSRLRHFSTGNAFSATVTPAQEAALKRNPAVAAVVPDTRVSLSPASAGQSLSGGAGLTARAASPKLAAAPADTPTPDSGAPAAVNPAACTGTASAPQLEPEALGTIGARSDDPSVPTAASLGIDGSGVTVGFIADGINPNNQGFIRSDGTTSAITDYEDFYGDGPGAPASGAEAFGDASGIAAQGNVVYDIAQFANPKVVSFTGGHCYIRIVGVAPGADVVALKAGSELLPNSAILQSIDYAVNTAHVDVLNESFGGDVYPDASARSTIALFNDEAVAAGTTVTVSSGDAGITGTIGNPSTDPLVISTAASTDSRIYEQTGYALAARFSSGTWQDSNISALSSGGVTTYGRTPDLVAPGEADWAVCDSGGNYSGCRTYQSSYADIQAFGGTSQSAPLTAGVAALVIQAYRTTHSGESPTPALVKQLITSTTRDLGFPSEEQGSGLIDAHAAVEAALTYEADDAPPVPATSQIVADVNQLTLSGATGSSVTGSVTLTNGGPTPITVTPTAHRLTGLSEQVQTVPISKTSSQITPYPTNAANWVYTKATFTVPSGAARLGAAIAWSSGALPGGPNGPVVRLSLFAPDGSFATNTRPQGGAVPANYGFVDVKQPAAGTWTAVLYTPYSTGFTGNVQLDTTTQKSVSVGTVSPSTITLQPGTSRAVTVRLPTQSVGGDTVDTLTLAGSNGQLTSVPVIVRAVIPTSSGSGRFGGLITGGNARGARAQSFSYAFTVPSGQKDVVVATKLSDDPGDLLQTILVDPNGEVPSVNTNAYSGAGGAQGLVSQNVATNPIPGLWHYMVVVQNPVTGKEITEPFTGTVTFNKVQVSSLGLPNNPFTRIKAGQTSTVKVRVTNSGSAPLTVGVDARGTQLTQVHLAPLLQDPDSAPTPTNTVPLPFSVDDLGGIPQYLVPPGTASLSVNAVSTVPGQVEVNSPAGGIDVFGDLTDAQGGNLSSTATVSDGPGTVGLGYWFPYVQEIGPFTDADTAADGSTTLTATAFTKSFDDAVSSPVGDPFLTAITGGEDPGNEVTIAPGTNAIITVEIAPTADPGTRVAGTLNIVAAPAGTNLFNTTGELLGAIPYQYTVG